MYFAEPKP